MFATAERRDGFCGISQKLTTGLNRCSANSVCQRLSGGVRIAVRRNIVFKGVNVEDSAISKRHHRDLGSPMRGSE
jgi:hypothetical protein